MARSCGHRGAAEALKFHSTRHVLNLVHCFSSSLPGTEKYHVLATDITQYRHFWRRLYRKLCNSLKQNIGSTA